MRSARRPAGSEYLLWAKTRSHSRFNLATSGVPNARLADLPVTLDDLEITGADSYGHVPLLEAIAAKCGAAPECVVTAAGTSMANHLALAALVEPGDEVVMERPVYDPVLSAARYLGADVRFFERRHETGYAVDPDEIARLATSRTRLVVLTNLHNPSSALVDDETLGRVGEIARRSGARVLVDEVYLDAVFDDTPRSSFHLGPEFVVTNSLTKVYGLSGLRCGWILARPATARRMWLLDDIFGASPVHAAERMSVVALGHLDALRARSRALLDANRAALHAFYDARDDLDAPRFAWGTTSFPRLARGRVDRLCEVLRERYETTVVPGAFFGRDEHFRVGLSCDEATFAGGLERLGAALDDLAGE
jgi:aspartate/methionine/tyrosine aminotransferase